MTEEVFECLQRGVAPVLLNKLTHLKDLRNLLVKIQENVCASSGLWN